MTTPELTAIIGGAAAWTLLFFAAVVAIARAISARREMERKTGELSERAEQLRLLNSLSVPLGQQSRRGGVMRAVMEFFVRELGAGQAMFWPPDSYGEPQAPVVSFPADEEAAGTPLLSEAHRIILARTAARGTSPLVLGNGAGDGRPRPLTREGSPEEGFALFIPFAGSPREGVLEVYSGGEPWGPARWEVLPALVVEVTSALQRARRYEEVRELADRDSVTGLFTHQFMQAYLQRLLNAEEAREGSFAVLLMDVDNFKTFNDTYGHSMGDRVLQVVAGQLKLMTDGVGVVGRFGGDEFIVVLPGHTRPEALAFAQAFQDWLASCGFRAPTGQPLPILVSWGLATFPDDGGRRQELLAAADARLYESKRSGVRANGYGEDGGGRLGVFGLLEGLVTSIDRKDHYTRAHCESTAEYAVMLALEMGMSTSAQRTLRLAALLHDVGKICIPDDILRKPGALTAAEFAVIRHHAAIADDLIVDVPNAAEVAEIARHHHERFDGEGYPDGLRGEEIPLLARVLALADAFSAMTLDRPHRRGLPPEEAYAELRRVAGTQLDPQLVERFRRVVDALRAGPAVSNAAANA